MDNQDAKKLEALVRENNWVSLPLFGVGVLAGMVGAVLYCSPPSYEHLVKPGKYMCAGGVTSILYSRIKLSQEDYYRKKLRGQ